MCFSPSASFIAGTSLCAVGVATLKRTEARSEIPFAMIPLLFGIQQLTEGVIWLTFSPDAPLLRQTMTYLYLGFSHVLWPLYVPFAMGVLEAVRWRKKAIFAFEVAGATVSLYLLYHIVTRPVDAEVIGMHIVYVSPHSYLIPMMVFYLAATCVSCFFSSHGFVKLFGVLALLFFFAAYLVHVIAVVSIWCFFAAILSLLIYLHLRFRDFGGFPRNLRFRRPSPAAP
ncbi:MAG: hypothetical protein QOC96_395 [Acidobacteriota bacterium]|jgi:hypothetical protein|nr:hypothetical protein [Acidobacteriota bacterium]